MLKWWFSRRYNAFDTLAISWLSLAFYTKEYWWAIPILVIGLIVSIAGETALAKQEEQKRNENSTSTVVEIDK